MKVEVIRSNRKTISLQVRNPESVLVRAPLFTNEKTIRQFVEQHLDWIISQQTKLKAAENARKLITPLTDKQWRELTEAARKDLKPRVEYYSSVIGVHFGKISIRHQKTKWGSCSSRGNLNFNCLLYLAPEEVRDYVVVHELCHRRHMNHSSAFWAEVSRILPEYKKSRMWLKQHGQELMMLHGT